MPWVTLAPADRGGSEHFFYFGNAATFLPLHLLRGIIGYRFNFGVRGGGGMGKMKIRLATPHIRFRRKPALAKNEFVILWFYEEEEEEEERADGRTEQPCWLGVLASRSVPPFRNRSRSSSPLNRTFPVLNPGFLPIVLCTSSSHGRLKA